MGEEDIDVEALQAQIDLSNSITYDLVSSWMKPASSSKPNTPSVSKAIAKELEEHAKRPSRLGLGALMSKANAATAHEAARLKGKLTGTKRAREGGEGGISTTQGAVHDDEDDTESRSVAISTKKIQINAVGGRTLGLTNKRKNNGKGGSQAPTLEEGRRTLATAEEDGSRKKTKIEQHGHGGNDESTHNVDINSVDPTPTKPNPFVLNASLTSTPAHQSVGNQPLMRPTPVVERPASPKKKKKHEEQSVNNSNKLDADAEEWDGFANYSPELDKDLHEIKHSHLDPNLSLPKQPVSLLNLDGPPAYRVLDDEHTELEGAEGEHRKKKKRRRRKGKKKKSEAGAESN